MNDYLYNNLLKPLSCRDSAYWLVNNVITINNQHTQYFPFWRKFNYRFVNSFSNQLFWSKWIKNNLLSLNSIMCISQVWLLTFIICITLIATPCFILLQFLHGQLLETSPHAPTNLYLIFITILLILVLIVRPQVLSS